jgi:hypothetical protein
MCDAMLHQCARQSGITLSFTCSASPESSEHRMRFLAATALAIAIVSTAQAQKVEVETLTLDNGMKFLPSAAP